MFSELLSRVIVELQNSQLEVSSHKLIHVFLVLKQSCVTLEILVYKGFEENKSSHVQI